MEIYELFYAWVPVYVRLPVLFLLYMVLLSANGVYLGNIPESYSDLGVYAEPYQMAYYAVYVGMAIGLAHGIRLKKRFASKPLLLFGLSMVLLMNIICATTSSPALTVLACFFLGILKITGLAETYLIWLLTWSKTFDRSRVYPFVYFTALTGLYLLTWLTTKLAYVYNWRYAYILIVIILLVCILLTIIFVEHHPLKKRIPLYQMDWPGTVLMTAFLMTIDYVTVYGKVEDWWRSNRIVGALCLLPVFLLLFIRRELFTKRPVYPLRLFTMPSVQMGLFLFLLLGIFSTNTIQSTFSTGVLNYEAYRNGELLLFLIPGVVAGSMFSFYWYYQKYEEQVLIIIGFVFLLCYHVLMYFNFGSDFTETAFLLPSVLKGFGLVVVYISVGLYATSGHKIELTLTVVGIALMFRSFIGNAIFTSLYSYYMYAQRLKHLNYFGSVLDLPGPLRPQELVQLNQQATLAASKEITGYIIIAGILVVVFLVIRHTYRKVNNPSFVIEDLKV